MIDDRRRPTIEVLDHRARRIDSQVMVDRGQEVARATDPFDDVLAALIGRSDEPSRFNSATGPDIRERSWPVVATWLHRTGRRAGITLAGAGSVIHLRRTPELARYNDEHALVEASFIDVFDQRGNGLVVRVGAETHRIEHVVVHRVIVPV